MRPSDHPASRSIRSRLAAVSLPLLRLEVPGWGRLAGAFGIAGIENDRYWRSAPTRTVRGKWHGYLMELSLADFSQRLTYFLARYHELDAQLLMNRCIRPGDRVADVGANIGMLTLHAASLVGPTGLVEAFEPNPACAARIADAADANRIGQIRLHRVGLSDAPATLTLRVLLNHTGMGTFSELAGKEAADVTSAVDVPVMTGDGVLLESDRPLAFVKMDVEGFETRALSGMRQTLARWKPIIATEMGADALERAGSSVAELTDFMRSLGYQGHGLGTRRKGLRQQLALEPLGPRHFNAVWVPTDGPHRARLR